MTRLKQENRQGKQAIHKVQYFLRFAYIVTAIQNTKKRQIWESPWDVAHSLGLKSTERQDVKLIVKANELLDKETRYHPSCYMVYIKPVKPLMGQNDTFRIDALRSAIDVLLASCEGHITFINDVKKTYLKKLEEEGVETKNATKNLRRSIEGNWSDIYMNKLWKSLKKHIFLINIWSVKYLYTIWPKFLK